MNADTSMPRSIHLALTGEVRTLLERTRYDLERGWNEAALDCIGRALRLLSDPQPGDRQ
ncbi:MAG: hypothetical protein ACP5P4_12160 [Steroidobacteraceae bacterium]